MRTDRLADPIDGLNETLDILNAFDSALVSGLVRAPAGVLAMLADAMAASPLADPVAEAIDKVTAGSVSEDHLTVLAGSRLALLGAAHDALVERADEVSGRNRLPWAGSPAPASAQPALGAARAWLTELAVTGWRAVDHELVSASSQMIHALLSEPIHRRLGILLDGLAAELRASVPIGSMPVIPARRWGDLWSRAFLLTLAPADRSDMNVASGRFLPLGVDLHEHPTVVQAQVHGVFETGGVSVIARATMSATKVDTITGTAIWRLFTQHTSLLTALAERRALDLTDAWLTGAGDLIWDERCARLGEDADPFTTARVALAGATAVARPPLDRHPAVIAEPVLIDGPIDLAIGRLPSAGPLTAGLVKTSSACIGLLRWDAGTWMLQPLAVQTTVKKKAVALHVGDWALGPTDPATIKAEAATGDPVAVLRERAGRLLRA